MWLKRLLQRYSETAWLDEQSDFEKMKEALRPSQMMPSRPAAYTKPPKIGKRKEGTDQRRGG